jgi:hypothetical protein
MQRTLLWFPSHCTMAHANDSTITLHETVMNFLWPVCQFSWSDSLETVQEKGLIARWEVILVTVHQIGSSGRWHCVGWVVPRILKECQEPLIQQQQCCIQEDLSHEGLIGYDAGLINMMCNINFKFYICDWVPDFLPFILCYI